MSLINYEAEFYVFVPISALLHTLRKVLRVYVKKRDRPYEEVEGRFLLLNQK
jgi:hypothetical protein